MHYNNSYLCENYNTNGKHTKCVTDNRLKCVCCKKEGRRFKFEACILANWIHRVCKYIVECENENGEGEKSKIIFKANCDHANSESFLDGIFEYINWSRELYCIQWFCRSQLTTSLTLLIIHLETMFAGWFWQLWSSSSSCMLEWLLYKGEVRAGISRPTLASRTSCRRPV